MIDFSKHLKPPYRIPLMSQINRMPLHGLKVASTFSGCGGSCLGYKMAGFNVVWANEFMPAAQETYRANFPKTILDCRDVKTVEAGEILAATGLKEGELDIFDGSPPCQGISMANQNRMKGKAKKYDNGVEQKNEEMLYEYIRLVAGLQPKVFIAENVKGLTVGAAREMLGSFQDDMFDTQEETILRSLMACGYRVQFQVLNSMHYGVPQSRQRVIFIGVRRDLERDPVFPAPLGYVYTVRDAIPWIKSV
jgi:DNA (cytosine-5)-methyltransferase 1